MNAGTAGALPANATNFVQTQQMRRFIFRSVVTATPAAGQVTPQQAAEFTNAVQAMSEASRLGIPSLFKSNARNHYEKDRARRHQRGRRCVHRVPEGGRPRRRVAGRRATCR